MMVRELPIRVGAVARTRDALPAGLAGGVEVTVLSYDKRAYNCVVRDAEGREWTIKALQNLDASREYLVAARWLPEYHPLALEELRKGGSHRFQASGI